MAQRFKSAAASEVDAVQNPALGAYAIWQFGLGFQKDDSFAAPVPLAFLVLPLVLHKPTLDLIVSTRKASGLALFAAKLGEQRENLLAVHERALLLRPLSLESIAVGTVTRLLTINYLDATIRANTAGRLPKLAIPERIKQIPKAAEKLGHWFSKVGLPQVAITLGVES